jgi:hypothetical protein
VFDAHNFGDVVVYDTLREKRGIVTANLTTPYMINFTVLEPGRPLVIDYPAGATAGGILDFWQRPLTDMGLTGPDGGAGGRFVVFAPGDDPAGYDLPDAYVVVSETANVFVAFRILDPAPAAIEAAKAGLRMHRWPDEGGDPARFVEGVDREWDAMSRVKKLAGFRSMEMWGWSGRPGPGGCAVAGYRTGPRAA